MGSATPEEDMIAWGEPALDPNHRHCILILYSGILKPDGTPSDPEMHKDIAQGASTYVPFGAKGPPRSSAVLLMKYDTVKSSGPLIPRSKITPARSSMTASSSPDSYLIG